MNYRKETLVESFIIPILVLGGTILYVILNLLSLRQFAIPLVFATVLLGTFTMFKETLIALTKKHFALDYIAIIAIIVGLYAHEYLVSAILSLMVTSGITLEEYGVKQAKKSLTQLVGRIPTDVILYEGGKMEQKVKLRDVKIGDEIFIRKGEVIPLDGTLVSTSGETDESSLTGEPYFIEKQQGDTIRSGTVNIGNQMVIKVTRAEKDSTYKKIVNMVASAQAEKSPMVRLADKYSTFFTIVTFTIAAFAYVSSHYDLTRVLAVLAVATPCPLIIATPIALLGGINSSAKRKIIIKKLASLEALSRVNVIVFDKTGTITLGRPTIQNIEIKNNKYQQKDILALAVAIERNSLHPLAKAIIQEANKQKVKKLHAENIQEIIGSGITGTIAGKKYSLKRQEGVEGMAIELLEDKKPLAVFHFEDEIKEESKKTLQRLKHAGLSLHLFTGDKKETAEKVAAQIGTEIIVRSQLSPAEKQEGIQKLKDKGQTTAMVGDGINDAPALALADVGLAFSNEEQTAASEAADIVLLGGDFSMVLSAWEIAQRTIAIAKQSITWGIGASIAIMLIASFGFVQPIFGAGAQEVIDVAVILNALRASR